MVLVQCSAQHVAEVGQQLLLQMASTVGGFAAAAAGEIGGQLTTSAELRCQRQARPTSATHDS